MLILKILGWILLAYGAILLFTGFIKNAFMIKMVRQKFGENISDKKAQKIMYISGVALLVVGAALLIIF